MRQHKKIVIERDVCTCDRCGKEMTLEDQDIEWHERFVIRFRGGYGSVFGDGAAVEGDFCQQCIYDLLGKYLRTTFDDPIRPSYPLDGDPARIYQPNQLAQVIQVKAFQEKLAEELASKIGFSPDDTVTR